MLMQYLPAPSSYPCTFTLSFLTNLGLLSGTATLTDSSNVTFVLYDQNGVLVSIYGEAGIQSGIFGVSITTKTSLDIFAAKLEEGEGQTLAYQKSDGTWAMLTQPTNYQQELAKCQAYLIVVNNKHYVNGAMYGTREGIFELSVPQMRTTPAIVSKSIERILDSKGTSIWTENISTVEVLSSDSAGVVLKVTTTVDAAIGPATLINFKAELTADL